MSSPTSNLPLRPVVAIPDTGNEITGKVVNVEEPCVGDADAERMHIVTEAAGLGSIVDGKLATLFLLSLQSIADLISNKRRAPMGH